MAQEKKFTLLKPLSDEEYNGVVKHSYNSFIIRILSFGCVLILLAFSFIVKDCTSSCSKNMIIGTWVRASDMTDGFDEHDLYVEFTADGEFLFCGSKKGSYTSGVRVYAVENTSSLPQHKYVAVLSGRELELTYPEYTAHPYSDYELQLFGYTFYNYFSSTASSSDIDPDMFMVSESDAYYLPGKYVEKTDIFVCISEETGLTEAQRSALY